MTEALADVLAYFERKTTDILTRYGPGPRVHFHTGLVDEPPPRDASIDVLRRSLVDSQEAMLQHAAALWGEEVRGHVLDVGCGLGGGSIFWAQSPRVTTVTALTIAPSHIPLIETFAAQAGVGDKVRAVLGDAHEVMGEFDCAVAIDSSGYLDRGRWFRQLAGVLKPGGSVHVVDCFLGAARYREAFDRYWKTRIGPFDEYLDAAKAAGFEHVMIEDITPRTKNFWAVTMAMTKVEIEKESRWAANHPNDESAALWIGNQQKREASLRAHELVYAGLSEGGLDYAIASWRNDRK